MLPCASHLLTPVCCMLPIDRTSSLAQSIYMRDRRWFVGRIGSGDGKMDPTRMEPAVCWGRRRGGWLWRSREQAGARCAGLQGFRRHIEREQRMVRAYVAARCLCPCMLLRWLRHCFCRRWASLCLLATRCGWLPPLSGKCDPCLRTDDSRQVRRGAARSRNPPSCFAACCRGH
jgi:hypothetical protein